MHDHGQPTGDGEPRSLEIPEGTPEGRRGGWCGCLMMVACLVGFIVFVYWSMIGMAPRKP
ncbi:MAG: hypothetical protein HY720_23905 [Planctomycetes bacterium]|nr:hypothetical protein [Planctomycetota bacterium]